MAQRQAEGRAGRGGDRPRIVVDDEGARRPFMRGILVHSLLSRGVPFDAAYQTADDIRADLRERGHVTREELKREVARRLAALGLAAESLAPALGPDVLVEGGGASLPFSKGVLSQSLHAAALEPAESFDVARRIEQRLVARGVRHIHRAELRRLTHDTLRKTVGERAADRYLVWRHYQDPDKPVILLLGGATGTGKTSLALEVAHRLAISRVMSTDAIRQVMRIMLSPELMPDLHRSSYELPEERARAPGADPVVEGFLSQAQTVSVGVGAMMDRSVDEHLSLVLDGVGLVPGLLDTSAYEGRAHVIFVVVASFDPEEWRSRLVRRGVDARGRPSGRYTEHLDGILRIQDYILEQADTHGVPIVDNQSFERSVLSLIRYVTETLGRKPDFDAASLL